MTFLKLTTLPKTASIEDALYYLDQDGAVIVQGQLSKLKLAALRKQLEGHFNCTKNCDGLFFGKQTKRVHSLVRKSQICREIIVNNLIVNIAKQILQKNCNQIQLNLTQGIRIFPGEKEQFLHRDDSMFPNRGFDGELMINAMWAYDDFTMENGATVIAPGSHRWQDKAIKPRQDEIAAAEMIAGDVLIYLGSVIHGGGANKSDHLRTGIAIGYCLGWLRQYENQYLVAPPQVARDFSHKLQDLLGYAVHRPNLGMYEGNEPRILFDDIDDDLTTRDWLTERQTEAIEKHYNLQNASSLQVRS